MSSPEDEDVYYTPATYHLDEYLLNSTPTSDDEKQRKRCVKTIAEIVGIVDKVNARKPAYEIKIDEIGTD